MSRKTPQFSKNSFVEAMFESNSLKKALAVCKKISTGEIIFTFTRTHIYFFAEPKNDKDDVFYGEFLSTCLPIYEYKLAYSTGLEVPSYTIKLSLKTLLLLPAFGGSSKKNSFHFYFKVRKSGRLQDDVISVVIERSTKDLDAEYMPKCINYAETFLREYADKEPSSKTFAYTFNDYTNTSPGDGIESFEFGLKDNGKINLYTKNYTETIIERNKKQNIKGGSDTTTKKHKKPKKLWISEYPLDKELAIEIDEPETANLEYGISILAKENKLFLPLCKLNPMTTVQFYLAKDKPLAIRFALGNNGYGTFIFNSLENDPMESTPKRTGKVFKESSSED